MAANLFNFPTAMKFSKIIPIRVTEKQQCGLRFSSGYLTETIAAIKARELTCDDLDAVTREYLRGLVCAVQDFLEGK